ncbi:MAG: hypothetical protein JOZ03_13960 [Gammaproteobacteria bacterium]|nr:hypothetical protein [Gammaproteobacteria bacterium]
MLKSLATLSMVMMSGLALAQVGTSAQESGHAASEKAKEVGDTMKSGVESEPDRSIDKAKAHVHKAKAHHHAHVAKEAAKDATH